MNLLSKATIAFKALNQLGFQQVSLNALYKFGLMTGHYKRTTDRGQQTTNRRPLSVVRRFTISSPPTSPTFPPIHFTGCPSSDGNRPSPSMAARAMGWTLSVVYWQRLQLDSLPVE